MKRASVSKLVAIALSLLCCAPQTSVAAAETEAWKTIKADLFGDRTIIKDDGVIALQVPDRAEDAAIVPLSFAVAGPHRHALKAVTIIIDNNPSPVAAAFEAGEAYGLTDGSFSTRVRIDSFTDVRAIAELNDGSLHMASHFVKASGGCSASPSSDMDEAMRGLGQIKIVRHADAQAGAVSGRVQIMIRHPNFSGMQIDQLTHGYTPARFINDVRILGGDKVVYTIKTGISISENPAFSFSLTSLKDTALRVTATDTDGSQFSGDAALAP